MPDPSSRMYEGNFRPDRKGNHPVTGPSGSVSEQICAFETKHRLLAEPDDVERGREFNFERHEALL